MNLSFLWNSIVRGIFCCSHACSLFISISQFWGKEQVVKCEVAERISPDYCVPVWATRFHYKIWGVSYCWMMNERQRETRIRWTRQFLRTGLDILGKHPGLRLTRQLEIFRSNFKYDPQRYTFNFLEIRDLPMLQAETLAMDYVLSSHILNRTTFMLYLMCRSKNT